MVRFVRFVAWLTFRRVRAGWPLMLVSAFGVRLAVTLVSVATRHAITLPDGGTTGLNRGDGNGSYDGRWYNPRTGGRLETGSVAVVTGAGQVSIGEPPRQPTQDWVVLITRRS